MNPWIAALVVPIVVADRTSTFWGGCVIASPFVIVMYIVGVGAFGGFS